MRRRAFVRGAAAGGLAGALMSSCSRQSPSSGRTSEQETFQWSMVTSWPPNFPAFGSSALRLARTLERNSNNRLTVRVYAGGELVPAFEVFDAVSRGTAQMGHSGPIFWRGKLTAAQFFSGFPFGMNAVEFNAWMYHGGGMVLWRKLYEPFNLVPFLAGNTGAQMGGWFNRRIDTIADLTGLKMRIPGLGGEVLARAGGTAVNLPGAELFTALQTGTIDATEWVGPYNDMAFGLHKIAKYYYYPGWQESAGTIECIINKEAFDSLPDDLQGIVTSACQAENDLTLTEIAANNWQALEALITEHNVEVRRFPDEVLEALKARTKEVLEEIASSDPASREVYDAYLNFQRKIRNWNNLSERFVLESTPLAENG